MYAQKLKHNPKSIRKKINILRKMGLNNDEIRYLVWKNLKNKFNN